VLAALAKADAAKAFAFAEALHDDLVAVLEESSLLAGGQFDGFRPAPAQLEHRAAF